MKNYLLVSTAMHNFLGLVDRHNLHWHIRSTTDEDAVQQAREIIKKCFYSRKFPSSCNLYAVDANGNIEKPLFIKMRD